MSSTRELGAFIWRRILTRPKARFVAVVDAQEPVGVGQHVEIGVDLAKLYFFDVESGAGLRYR